MTEPTRIRLSRAPGFRLADVSSNYRVVSRSSKFGNPFTLDWARLHDPDMPDEQARKFAVGAFRGWLDGAYQFGALADRHAWILEHLHELAGKDLACWCPMPADGQEDHCHAAVLIHLANAAGTTSATHDARNTFPQVTAP